MKRPHLIAAALVTETISRIGLAASGSPAGTVLYPMTLPVGITSVAPTSAAEGQIVGNNGLGISSGRAILWAGSATAVDLTPAGFNGSSCFATNGTQQAGSAFGMGSNPDHVAIIWSGSAASAVNLNPTGYFLSELEGTDGIHQVGDVAGTITGSYNHAALWSGTAGSFIDLNPAGYQTSGATAVSEAGQVGFAAGPSNDVAMLWKGSAASAVNLNPAGFNESLAKGIGGNQQVGWGSINGGNQQAFLWSGTALSAVDLNPSGFSSSLADATNGSEQVGYGTVTAFGPNQALLWTGSAGSAVELQSELPASGSWTDSEALSVDAAGNVFGYADGTYNGVTGTFAVEWPATAVPEPAFLSFLFATAALLSKRRR